MNDPKSPLTEIEVERLRLVLRDSMQISKAFLVALHDIDQSPLVDAELMTRLNHNLMLGVIAVGITFLGMSYGEGRNPHGLLKALDEVLHHVDENFRNPLRKEKDRPPRAPES